MPGEGDIDPQNPEKSKDHRCIGISRGGRSTKIHAVVDALGNPLHIQLSAGNVDVTVAQDLLSHVDFEVQPFWQTKPIAYSKWAFRKYIADHDADFCIPPKSNECDPWYCDWWLYKERHLVENFFLKLKEFRCVATRYDKLARRFLGFVFLACICILLA